MAMKFRAHDTLFIRRGWLSKGMKYVRYKPDVFVAKEENPMDVPGIGANMVKALRYWLQAVGEIHHNVAARAYPSGPPAFGSYTAAIRTVSPCAVTVSRNCSFF